MAKDTIYVTRPTLPDLDEYHELLKDIWKEKWLTNEGKHHKNFEKELKEFLEAENLSLFVNGTLALIVGLQALRITGEVITTPYSFVASSHSLMWNNIKPVFCDIRENDLTINSEKIEALITPQTTAIMPVHVYGHPCDVDSVKEIADIYGLKVIYDAAHAFGVRKDNSSILNHGDISILSFHATKVFNTVEGGAIASSDNELINRINFLKNFGFKDETTVIGTGINGKMNELIAAYGLLQLKKHEENVQQRKEIAEHYFKVFKETEGITCVIPNNNIQYNYAYFPILIDNLAYKKSRDDIFQQLYDQNIITRRYFYPLISHFPAYRGLPSASAENLPVAEKIAQQVLCLPIYPGLTEKDVQKIIEIIIE